MKCKIKGCTNEADPDIDTFGGCCEECAAEEFNEDGPPDQEVYGPEQFDDGEGL